MRLRPQTLRDWIVIVFATIGIALLPWTVWLSASLSPHHAADNWDLAWSGFDTALAVLFIATALAAYRRSPWVGALSASLGTLLVVDAWFDVLLESHADEQRTAIMLAIFGELPVAALCFWISYRTERFLAKVVDEVEELHLAPPRKGAAESDLVGVLEVPADGESTGESGHADSAA